MDPVLSMLQALSDPTRYAIFECIRCCGGATAYDTDTGLCDAGCANSVAACDVRCKVPCSPSSMSRHFGALRDAGLIATERRGRELYARVEVEALAKLAQHFSSVGACKCGCEVKVDKELSHV